MTDIPIPPKANRPLKTHAQVKAERLQAALRENLRRRKVAHTVETLDASCNHEKASQKNAQNPTE